MHKHILSIFLLALQLACSLSWQAQTISAAAREERMQLVTERSQSGNEAGKIVLAGGCFWGVEEYFSRIPGVLETRAGYAQSEVASPGYEQVCSGTTVAVEAIEIIYDPAIAPLELLLRHFFRIIDPLSVNRQGNDTGTQYRTGIYFEKDADRDIAAKIMARIADKLGKPLAVELAPLVNFYPAEEYHQDYLKKNPGGYCHINFKSLHDSDLRAWKQPDDATLKKFLQPEAFFVTRQNGTEPPFSGKYNDTKEPGIYVDIVSGQPLFASSDKFQSGCGWPAFSAPITQNALTARRDSSHNMERVEVRSSLADSHLGHVFTDGPKDRGGLRFCINSAALRFIPLEDMDREGYSAYKKYVKKP